MKKTCRVRFNLKACAALFVFAVAVTQLFAQQTASVEKFAGPTRALGFHKPGVPVGLEEGFANPPAISRAQCWWQLLGSALTKKEITRELEEFHAKGMGGVTLKDTLPMPRDPSTEAIRDLTYMSDAWLDMFAHIVSECQRLDMICRSRLGSGWNCGGPWVTPAMSSQNLVFAKSDPIVGPKHYSGPIPKSADSRPAIAEVKSGEALVVATRRIGDPGIDLTAKVDGSGNIEWDVPEGTWTILSCFSQTSGIGVVSCSPGGAGLLHDHLSTAGTDLQLQMVAERMFKKIGRFDRTAFDGFNCDSWEVANPTWTPGLCREFFARRGYDPTPYLSVLVALKDPGIGRKPDSSTVGDLGRRFLHDFRDTVGELIIETHYRRINQWCREHGGVLEAQAGGPSIVPRDMISAQGAVDIPMGEFWGDKWTCIRIASSAAHAYGKPLVGLESFTDTRRTHTSHIDVSPSWLKPRVDDAFWHGGNYLTMAVVEYSPKEAGLPGWVHNAGPHLNHCQTWWPMARPFYDYLARCCFLLQSGQPVCHVAEYRPHRTEKGELWDEVGDEISVFPTEFAFDYVNDELVQQHMRVKDGQIKLASGMTYQVLYIAETQRRTMPLATLAKIRDLARQGAIVVWAGDSPIHTPGLVGYPKCDEELRALVKDLWASGKLICLPTDDRRQLIPILTKAAHPPAWQSEDARLRFVHRRTADTDIFFVSNPTASDIESEVKFSAGGRVPELWDPELGRIESFNFTRDGHTTSVTLRLPGHGSRFVLFRAKASAQPVHCDFAASPQSIEVPGPWDVSFPKGSGAPDKVVFPFLKPWTAHEEPGIRFFSGIATYSTSFACEKLDGRSHAVLDLGGVADLCEVRVNDKPAGVCWHPPYRLEVTSLLQQGTNRLEIRVANTWFNRIIGDAALPKEQRMTRVTPDSHYKNLKHFKPRESGLLGPVKILLSETQRPEKAAQ